MEGGKKIAPFFKKKICRYFFSSPVNERAAESSKELRQREDEDDDQDVGEVEAGQSNHQRVERPAKYRISRLGF